MVQQQPAILCLVPSCSMSTRRSSPSLSTQHTALHCRIERYGIKAAPAAPLARRQRRAQPWRGPPGARRATRGRRPDQDRSLNARDEYSAQPLTSLPIVQLAAAASMAALRAVASDRLRRPSTR
jgi:hypothetical protein